MFPRNMLEGIFEKKLLFMGYLPIKTSKLKRVKQVPYCDQPTAGGTHCREILFTIVQSFAGHVNIFIWHRVSELWAVKFPIFSFFAYFFLYKTPKKYLLVHGLQPSSYVAACFWLFSVVVEGPNSKGVLLVPFSLDIWWETRKFALIFAYGKCLCMCTMLLHCTSDLDQQVLKTRHSA